MSSAAAIRARQLVNQKVPNGESELKLLAVLNDSRRDLLDVGTDAGVYSQMPQSRSVETLTRPRQQLHLCSFRQRGAADEYRQVFTGRSHRPRPGPGRALSHRR
ncbi:hypothetical protein MPHO_08670 [Mycolicibacterium phocaicum]|nr:hypothetical protein MPHO_08670 [Mycolicibacterium phocaicum]